MSAVATKRSDKRSDKRSNNRSGRPSGEPDSRVEEALRKLEGGVSELVDGEAFRRYLSVAARFHRYSANNCLLILIQRPHATRVAGYNTWRTMGRHVRKGEKGIKILAPISRKVSEDRRAGEDDKASEARKASQNGRPGEPGGVSKPEESSKADKAEGRAVVGFKTATVFDVSQTEGEDLPEAPRPEDLDPIEGQRIAEKVHEGLLAFCESEGVAVVMESRRPGSYGSYRPRERRIVLNNALPATEKATTLAHELAHHLLHDPSDKTPKAIREIEAEGVAFVTCAAFGLDTSRFTFAYLANHAQKKETVRAALQTIQRASRRLIEAVEAAEEGAHRRDGLG